MQSDLSDAHGQTCFCVDEGVRAEDEERNMGWTASNGLNWEGMRSIYTFPSISTRRHGQVSFPAREKESSLARIVTVNDC